MVKITTDLFTPEHREFIKKHASENATASNLIIVKLLEMLDSRDAVIHGILKLTDEADERYYVNPLAEEIRNLSNGLGVIR